MKSLQLRPTRSDDEPFLFRLYAETRRDELLAFGWNEAERSAFLKLQFAAQQQSYPLQYPQAENQIILLDQMPIGRMIVDRAEHEFRLVDITLLPDHRGVGVGTRLILELIEEAAKTGRPVALQVLRTNPAQRLYKRLGLVQVGDDGMHLQMERRPPQDDLA